VVPLVGQDFYGRVRAAHAIVQTSEPRLYANIILRKGVIYPRTGDPAHSKGEVDPFVY
jgi:L-fucose mutarotase